MGVVFQNDVIKGTKRKKLRIIKFDILKINWKKIILTFKSRQDIFVFKNLNVISIIKLIVFKKKGF